MSIKLADLAEELGLKLPELKKKIIELGFEISPRARVLDDEIATLVKEEFSAPAKSPVLESLDDTAEVEEEDEAEEGVADVYDEMIAQERERELIKSQRKKMAGKDLKSKSEREKAQFEALKRSEMIELPDVISVKEFSEKTGIKIAKIIGELMKNGVLANINQEIDFETAQIIADDMGVKVKRIRMAAGAEELMAGDITNMIREDDENELVIRPPVVCIMGHVDHGKTKLLDTIRETDVVSGESGGITQHIGAYQVEKKGRLITFLDTPGHEAFTAMRARGAKVTDIAVLVVASDEGVKPQTVEALNHAKEAGVPIIVAINKMDKPDANPDKVKAELAEHGLQPEEWGGTTIMVPVSAMTGAGIDDLLDMILLTADMDPLKANPNREAVGTVIEANLDHNLGPVATILVNTGTLKITNPIIVGNAYGRIKLMKDHRGRSIRIAGPSTPVLIAGLSETPKSGDILQVVSDEKEARSRAEEISLISKKQLEEKVSGMGQIISSIKSDKILKLVLKADTKGSLEALKQSIAQIKDEDVAIKIIHSGVGLITKSDVMMAAASSGLILAFHATFDSIFVEKTAEREGVEVKQYTIIYNLLEDLKKLLSGLIDPELLKISIGKAEVKQIFLQKKKEYIIGCRVLSGKLVNKSSVEIVRGRTKEDESNMIGVGTIDSLRKVDEKVSEIGEGNECGVRLVSDITVQPGDIIEAFKTEEKRRNIV